MIARLIGLPRWAQGLLGAGVLITAFLVWDWFDDRAAVRAHETKVQAQVTATAIAAASDAAGAVTTTRNEVEQANAKARNSAAHSPDPLRAGLDRLRAEAGAPKPAAARPDDLRR